ncbi:MAG: glycerate kinase [Elusimicrobiaceae bacterium]|nr:glycerate kinase [Elusimicrobiaceae bacterium]
MKILALPNAFKGSLSARAAGQIFVRELSPRHRVRALPISDGGDGLLDFFKTLDPQAKTIFLSAKNAFLKNKRTSFLLLSDKKTAVIETAKICGLGRAEKSELDPLGASSYGVGQAILAAAKRGAKTIYVGLGGVACNDGGAGMAQACGAQLLNKKNQPIKLGAQSLLQLHRVDLSPLKKLFKGIKIIGIADVTNPLLGPLGSARVFGPQKGATQAQVKILEKALTIWANALKKETGIKISHVKSTGAAGAIAAGLYGCFGATLCLGAEELFKKAKLEYQIKWADFIITTEGKLDNQTFYGKAPGTVLQWAKKYRKPVLFICGQTDENILRRKNVLPDKIAVLIDFAKDENDAKKHTAKYLRRVLKGI